MCNSVLVNLGIAGKFYCSTSDRKLVELAICNLPSHSVSRKLARAVLYFTNRLFNGYFIPKKKSNICFLHDKEILDIGKYVRETLKMDCVHWVGVPQTNSGRKRLYLYYYDSNYKGICFLKIGFDKKSRIKIRHEMSALAKVRNTLNDAVSSLYVPSVLGFSSFKSCDVLVLEMIKSESNLHSEIEQARKDLILGFVGQGNIVSMDKVRGSSWFQYLDSERLYSADNFKHDFYNKFQSTIRLGSVHGDLTQANLVRSSKGVCVIDWEDYHDFAPTKVDCVNYDIQKYARMDCHKLVDNFTNENLNAVSDKEYFEILVALLFLAWSGREIASLIIDNWPEK